MLKCPILLRVLLCGAFANAHATEPEARETRWYKGNTHTHTLWSDGNDFPEMVVDWYREHGYDFLALSDHNILSEGEKWMRLVDIEKRRKSVLGKTPLAKYQKRFPNDWVELRGEGEGQEVRLKPLSEFRSQFEKQEEFLLVQAEEISASFEVPVKNAPASDGEKPPAKRSLPIHLNALGLEELIKPEKGNSVTDTIRKNVRAAQAQAERLGREIMVHLNHPNFGWGVTAEDLAHAVEEEFFEVYNGHPSINHLGDETHPGDERIWDLVNSLRLGTLNAPALLGLATDDSHTYHGGDVRPGRGWVMVQANSLSSDGLIRAMKAGDFYASTGVSLRTVSFDSEARRCRVEVAPEEGETYRIEFVGSLRGGGPESVGVVFATHIGTSATYEIGENELYVRATITSNANHTDPSFPLQKKQAWTQPVGWR